MLKDSQLPRYAACNINYFLPDSPYEDWRGSEASGYIPSPRQQALLNAYASAKESGLFYTHDVVAFASAKLGLGAELLALNTTNVDGGDFAYKMDLATRTEVIAWEGLTLVEHAIAIQADQVVIHLGVNDIASPADRYALSAYLFGFMGEKLAGNGVRLAIVEAPYPVPEDTFGPTNPTSDAYMDYVYRRDSLNSGIDDAVAYINAKDPGFATRVRYWSDGAVAMTPGSTHEGLHPTLAKHSAIAAAVAADVKAFRGW